jgi:hypothetical protein
LVRRESRAESAICAPFLASRWVTVKQRKRFGGGFD